MRSLSSALQTAVVQPVVPTIMLVRIDFDSGVMAWNSGYRDIMYDGVTYVAAGHLGSISPTREAPGIKAAGISITLSGVKPEIVSLLLSEPYMNRPVRIYLAVTDEQWAFNADLTTLYFRGRIDTITGSQGQTSSFTVAVRSRLADWERQRTLRYTDADQQKLHPGDKGMEFIAQLSQRKIIWPKAAFQPDPRD